MTIERKIWQKLKQSTRICWNNCTRTPPRSNKCTFHLNQPHPPHTNQQFPSSCLWYVLGRTLGISVTSYGGIFALLSAATFTNGCKNAKMHSPGTLFAILLKQVVKTSYKCIGSSSLAAILSHYWHQAATHCLGSVRIVKNNCQRRVIRIRQRFFHCDRSIELPINKCSLLGSTNITHSVNIGFYV